MWIGCGSRWKRALAEGAGRLRSRDVRGRDAACCLAAILLLVLPGLAPALSPAVAAEGAARESPAVFLLGPVAMPIFLAAVALLPSRIRRESPRDVFGFREIRPSDPVLGLCLGIAVIPLLLATGFAVMALEAAFGIEPDPQPALRMLSDAGLPGWRKAYLVFATVAVSPVGEELAFRGILLPALLRRRGAAAAVLLSSLFFGAIHLNLDAFLPVSCVGACFALAYLATGRILVPVAMHATYNAAALLLDLLA